MPENRFNDIQNIKKEVSQIHQSGFSFRHKFLEFKFFLERICKEITKEETLQFPSLFSRIVFIAQKYKLPQHLERGLHRLRTTANFLLKDENNIVTETQYISAYQALELFLDFLNGEPILEVYKTGIVDERAENESSLEKLRVQVVNIDTEKQTLVCRAREGAESLLAVRLGVHQVNDIFEGGLKDLWIGAQINLIDCKVANDGAYVPSMLVLEPDYLIDASAMAECFQNYGNSHLHYFRRKFEPMANTHYILLGNLANFFLDELIYSDHPELLDFNTLFLKSFKDMPFEFTACKEIETDIAFRDFMIKAKQQFENIKRVVLFDLKENGFVLDRCVLEPSFYSEKYGFQGRLDMLQVESEDSFARIIELKSGKTPWPQDDVTKIAPNHETQTSVYRLMIQSVFEKKARNIHAMILYSSAPFRGQNLRLSAPFKRLEKEIVNARNLIVATEHKLYTGNAETVEEIFEELLDLDSYDGRTPDFFAAKLAEIKKILLASSDLERQYFYRFVSFVSRELYLLKMGDEGYESSMSLSALWNTSFLERKLALELVSDLVIVSIEEGHRDMKILFNRQSSNDFVNFREGEICILYPKQTAEDSILSNQILKGTVIAITAEDIEVRFRYKQRSKSYFEENKYWVIEHDKLDHGYNAMYKSLYAFMEAPQAKKDLLLGLVEPKTKFENRNYTASSKDEKTSQVLQKAIDAEDYFLIVGPPGTGKTSIFARQLIERFYNQPNTNILVLAYTNRAVDELCASICNAFGESEDECDKYIRIGSEYSCSDSYRARLLQNISDNSKSRKELLHILQSARIYVGTLASILGKPEIFQLKHFDVAIIDEASQILESQIIGLLPQFDKFIMIGDHKQLSTITLQSELKSSIDVESLNAIGLYDCRESIFERLFRTVKENGWEKVYDTLDYHGRMHQDIAYLVNESFYDGRLIPATERQTQKLELSMASDTDVEQIVVSSRVSFVDIESLDVDFSNKSNKKEAETVVEIAKSLVRIYEHNNREFDCHKTLGIIAPYRNQIALIKHLLEETNIPTLKGVMVDTVERYQGSQRDVIIVSFCFNRPFQMKYFANMNREGTVDRKLNVALTRAREQLFLVGNGKILKQNKLYKSLLDAIHI